MTSLRRRECDDQVSDWNVQHRCEFLGNSLANLRRLQLRGVCVNGWPRNRDRQIASGSVEDRTARGWKRDAADGLLTRQQLKTVPAHDLDVDQLRGDANEGDHHDDEHHRQPTSRVGWCRDDAEFPGRGPTRCRSRRSDSAFRFSPSGRYQVAGGLTPGVVASRDMRRAGAASRRRHARRQSGCARSNPIWSARSRAVVRAHCVRRAGTSGNMSASGGGGWGNRPFGRVPAPKRRRRGRPGRALELIETPRPAS